MRRLILIIALLLPIVASAQKMVVYETNSLAFANTNLWKSNLTASAGISLAYDASGRPSILGRALQATLAIDGTNVVVDFATNDFFALTLTTNVWFSAPTNLALARTGYIHVLQDTNGNWAASFDTNYWKFPSATPPTITTNAGAWDILTFVASPTGTNLMLQRIGDIR
jgi:hypothetical protein